MGVPIAQRFTANTKEQEMFKIELCGAVNFKWAKETHRKFFSTYESLSWTVLLLV